MSSAPLFNDWKALRVAALALIAAGVTGKATAFLKAVREAKAAALVLLFALARSLWPEDAVEEKDPKAPGPWRPRRSPLWTDRDEDAWRNPPAIAFGQGGRPGAPPKKSASDPKRLERRVTQAFQALQQILSLCEDPDGHAARLRRRLDRVDAPLMAAEEKAFSIHSRAQDRGTREARRFIDQTWRGRRRRESG